jgi:hypothetical protein
MSDLDLSKPTKQFPVSDSDRLVFRTPGLVDSEATGRFAIIALVIVVVCRYVLLTTAAIGLFRF